MPHWTEWVIIRLTPRLPRWHSMPFSSLILVRLLAASSHLLSTHFALTGTHSWNAINHGRVITPGTPALSRDTVDHRNTAPDTLDVNRTRNATSLRRSDGTNAEKTRPHETASRWIPLQRLVTEKSEMANEIRGFGAANFTRQAHHPRGNNYRGMITVPSSALARFPRIKCTARTTHRAGIHNRVYLR